MAEEACCTCATLLSNIIPLYDEKSEKPMALDRRLDCCGRVICTPCIYNNYRFGTYCPFCQASAQPPHSLRDIQRNASTQTSSSPPYADSVLPSYSSLSQPILDTKSSSSAAPADDVLHFLNHDTDTLTSVSLRYNVPLFALRRANGITSDHLLLARRTVLIPGNYYKGGVSLSPRPVEGEEEERRKSRIRRWMVRCKVSEYDIALIYLEHADYDLEAAIQAYNDDEMWEKKHPIGTSLVGKGKARHDIGIRRFTGCDSNFRPQR